ncbi:hypothetical protein Tco_0766756 [Tanacetum coccineum]
MHESLRAIQSQFKFLIDTLQDFGTMPIFKRTFSQDLDLLEQHLTKEIISQTDCKTILIKLKTTFENAFNSEFKERLDRTWIQRAIHVTIGQENETYTNTGKWNRSEVQDDNSRGSGNDTDADDADIRPVYDEEPMAEVQLTAECNIFAIGQQHIEQLEIINEGRVDQYHEQCQVKSHMLDSSPDNQTTDYSKQSLASENILLKKTEPVVIMDRDIKRLKQSRIPIVKVRWNSRRGPEFTWEREDQFRKKYPHLFTKTAPLSSAAS